MSIRPNIYGFSDTKVVSLVSYFNIYSNGFDFIIINNILLKNLWSKYNLEDQAKSNRVL